MVWASLRQRTVIQNSVNKSIGSLTLPFASYSRTELIRQPNSSVARLACPQYRSGQLSYCLRTFRNPLKQTRNSTQFFERCVESSSNLDPVLTSFRILTFCRPGEIHTRSIHIPCLRQLPLREESA